MPKAKYCRWCGNLINCVCKIKKNHKERCRYRRAAVLSFEIPCDHGFQACKECDPCTCGFGQEINLR